MQPVEVAGPHHGHVDDSFSHCRLPEQGEVFDKPFNRLSLARSYRIRGRRRMDLGNAADDVRRYLVTTALNGPSTRPMHEIFDTSQSPPSWGHECKSIVEVCCEWAKTSLEKMSQAIKVAALRRSNASGSTSSRLHLRQSALHVDGEKVAREQRRGVEPITFDTHCRGDVAFRRRRSFGAGPAPAPHVNKAARP